MRSVCRNASVPPDKYIMSEIHFEHKPVLFKETIESLNIDPEGTYIDGTAGGGGHSGAILQRLTTGTLLSIDRDPDAIAVVNGLDERNRGYLIPAPSLPWAISAIWTRSR